MASRENQHRNLESMSERQLHQMEKIVAARVQEECQQIGITSTSGHSKKNDLELLIKIACMFLIKSKA